MHELHDISTYDLHQQLAPKPLRNVSHVRCEYRQVERQKAGRMADEMLRLKKEKERVDRASLGVSVAPWGLPHISNHVHTSTHPRVFA